MCGSVGKCGENCGKVCWGVGEMKGDVERGVGKCAGVWKRCGEM